MTDFRDIVRRHVAVILAFVVIILWVSILRSGTSYSLLAGRILAPVVVLLVFVHFERFLPVWLFLVVFPIYAPVGGSAQSLAYLAAVLLFGVSIARHALKKDVLSKDNVPWQLWVIGAGILLAFARNPAMPTRLIYQYGDIGSGFRRYAEEAVKWSSVIYICFCARRLRNPGKLLAFIRKAYWIALILRAMIYFSYSPRLYGLIGEDYYQLLYRGYLPRLTFVAPVALGLLAANLCWSPKSFMTQMFRFIAIVGSILIAGSGGTRTVFLGAIIILVSYLLLKRKTMHLIVGGLLSLSAFAIFCSSPTVRSSLPWSYQRAFLLTPEMRQLEALDDMAAQSADTMEYRREVWGRSLEDIKKSPIIGNGFRPAPIDMLNLTKEDIYERQAKSVRTHCVYLGLALAWGIPVACVILWWFIQTYIRGIRLIWRKEASAHSLLGFCLVSIPSLLAAGVFAGATLKLEQVIWLAMAHVLISQIGQQTSPPKVAADEQEDADAAKSE